MPAKTVTVTGGSGFVGQLLRRGLKKRGYRILVFDKARGVLVDLLRHKYLANARYPGVVRGLSKRINRLLAAKERLLTRFGAIRPTLDNILGARSQIAARFRGSDAVVYLAAYPHPNVPGVTAPIFRGSITTARSMFLKRRARPALGSSSLRPRARCMESIKQSSSISFQFSNRITARLWPKDKTSTAI